MSLTHAILGILNCYSVTGYDLKTRYFDGSIAHFWPADQAQIYRTLDKLAEEGWVQSQIEYQQDRPNRKVYSITDSGRAELERWLHTEQPLSVYREPFLIQLFFGADLTTETVIALLEHQLQQHRQRLAVYEAVPLPDFDTPGLDRETNFQLFTLDLGLRLERTQIEWLEATMERVKKLAAL